MAVSTRRVSQKNIPNLQGSGNRWPECRGKRDLVYEADDLNARDLLRDQKGEEDVAE